MAGEPRILRYERQVPRTRWQRWRSRVVFVLILLGGIGGWAGYKVSRGAVVWVAPVTVFAADDGIAHVFTRGRLFGETHFAYPVIRGRIAIMGVSRGANVRAAGIIGRLENRGVGAGAGSADSVLQVKRAELVTAQAGGDPAAIRRASESLQAAMRASNDAALRLRNTYITSPVNGVVVRRMLDVGANVVPNGEPGATPVAEVVNLETLFFLTRVQKDLAPQLRVNDRVVIVLDSLRRSRFAGIIQRIEPPAGDSADVRIKLDVPDRRTLPGFAGRVQLTAHVPRHTSRPRRVLVPSVAVRRDEGQVVVWLVRNDRLERRAVDLLPDSGGLREVRAGLTGGEVLVLRSAVEPRSGLRVQAKREPQHVERRRVAG